MAIIEFIRRLQKKMGEWPRHLHAHAEAAFEGQRTLAHVARTVESYGLSVHMGQGRVMPAELTYAAPIEADLEVQFLS